MYKSVAMIFKDVIKDEILNNFYLNNNRHSILIFDIFAKIIGITALNSACMLVSMTQDLEGFTARLVCVIGG